MNKTTYEVLQDELDELNLEALPTKSQIGRMQNIEEQLEVYKETYEAVINLSVGDKFTKETAELFCKFMSDSDEDMFRDITYAIPLGMDINESIYPIGETLLIIRGPEGGLYDMISCLMVDEDEYEVVYIYKD